jgi:hypothetical protein
MRDTANILLGCDLRQAEVAQLIRLLHQNNESELLVKLAKGAVERELDETRMYSIPYLCSTFLFAVFLSLL